MDIYMLELEAPEQKLPGDLLPYVSESRREKIYRYRFNIDRLLSLYGALIVNMGISIKTGLKYDTFIFTEGQYGKPQLKDHPEVHFNLSHTKNYILCGIADEALGVDVEKQGDKTPYDIMNRVYHQEEIAYINTAPDRSNAFFRIWTRKEAFIKHDGMGLNMDLVKINTLDGSNQRGDYLTWNDQDYVCSLYYQKRVMPNFTKLTVTDLYQFYIGSGAAGSQVLSPLLDHQ